MSERRATEIGLEYLREECFYVQTHSVIFKAMMALTNTKQPIDLYTVGNELKAMEELDNIGGIYFLSQLTGKIASTAHTEAWVKIILEKYIQRELIRISSEIIQDSYDPSANVFDLMNDAESKLFSITNNFIKKNYQKISEGLVGVVNRILEMQNQKSEISGLYTGFRALDNITNGWQKTDLIILAARPGLGKTAFALNLARNTATHKIKPTPVAFFSLEMSTGQLIERLLSAESGIRLEQIKKGRLTENEMQRLNTKGIMPLSEAPIYIDDTSALNIFELRSKAKKLVANHNVGLIIIDYLQIMSGGGENRTFNREQEISKISRELKSLAKELDIPIIALSQLNRNTEGRSKDGVSKRPMLSDLRESGAIEQDADMVVLLYRDDYYGIENNELGENIKGLVEANIAKHRNGELGTLKLRAMLDIQRFEDWDEQNIHSFNSYNDTPNQGETIIKASSKMKPLDDETPF
ncbi:replicative DNA helicase DnaB-like [Rhinoderma darwinii]|uniref:replicative DNA helicase DnaB-like n=1 Tax=Rhinoderma darwinii TaxID=43563 RepID=UPI003F66EB1F